MLIRSLDDYGGALANYASVVDPTTDEDAKFRNRAMCDTGMLTHTGCLAIASFVAVNGASPTDPTDFVHDARWGNGVAVKPVVARTAEGVVTFTFPTTVSDDLTAKPAALGGGVTWSTNFRRAFAQAQALAGVLGHAAAEVTSPNVLTVRTFLANGTADDLPGYTITVWAW
jgi:hypothetical protein